MPEDKIVNNELISLNKIVLKVNEQVKAMIAQRKDAEDYSQDTIDFHTRRIIKRVLKQYYYPL